MKRFVASVTLFLGWISCTSVAYAQNTQVPQGAITVEPSKLEFRLEQGASEQAEVKIINEYDVQVALQAELQSVESDTGRIIPAGPLNAPLASALQLSESSFSIPAHAAHSIKLSAVDGPGLKAGGQYASLVISEQTDSSDSSVVHPQISVGIFVIKKQGEIQKIELSKYELTRKKFQFPTHLSVELINDGNVHLVPRGYVRVQDKNEVYFEAVLNLQSQVIMQNERFTQDLSLYANPSGFIPHKVSVEVGYRADGLDEIKLHREEFWYVPWFVLPSTLIVLGGAGYMMVFFVRKRTKD